MKFVNVIPHWLDKVGVSWECVQKCQLFNFLNCFGFILVFLFYFCYMTHSTCTKGSFLHLRVNGSRAELKP